MANERANERTPRKDCGRCGKVLLCSMRKNRCRHGGCGLKKERGDPHKGLLFSLAG